MGRISPNWQKNPLCAWRIGRGGWSFGYQRKFRRPLDYWDLRLRGSSGVSQLTVINWWDHRAAACEGRSYWHVGYKQVSENTVTLLEHRETVTAFSCSLHHCDSVNCPTSNVRLFSCLWRTAAKLKSENNQFQAKFVFPLHMCIRA